MALPPRTQTTDWPAEIGAMAEEEMIDVEGAFWVPGATIPYDEATDSTTGPPTLFYTPPSGLTRIQHFRSTTDAYDSSQWTTQVNVRLQMPLDPEAPFIRRGLIWRTTRCDKFPPLEDVVLEVESAINSSRAAVMTINTVTQLVKTPPIAVP